jgi:tetratricopeptide (TPR) repeat protein
MNGMQKLISILLTVLLISIHASSYQSQKNLIDRADLYLDMMEYKAAIDFYLLAISKNLKKRDIQKRIAYAYFQLKKFDDALQAIQEELKIYPDNEDAYDLLAYILFKLDKVDEADNFLEIYGSTINLTENNPHLGGLACFMLGMHSKEIKKYDRAVKYFRKALEKDYDPVKCFVQLIDIELIQEGPKYARGIFIEAKKKCGDQPEFILMKGLMYLKLSKKNIEYLPVALSYFKIAAAFAPDFKEALFNLACLRYNSGDFKKASQHFRSLLKKDPEYPKIEFYLDCCLDKLNKSTEISPQCPKFIDLTENFIDQPEIEYEYKLKNDVAFVLKNICNLAFERIKSGRFWAAIKKYQNALKIYPEHPVINYNLGMLYLNRKSLRKAEKHALIALRKKDFFYTIPDIFGKKKLNDYEKEKLLKNASQSEHISPDIPLSRWTFDAALKEGNLFLEAYSLLGNTYYRKSEYKKAVLAFKKVIELREKDALAHYNLGCAFRALHDLEKAEEEWKKAIAYEKGVKERKEQDRISQDVSSILLIVEVTSVSFRAHKALGELYLEKNLKDKALDAFITATELSPSDPEPYFEVGKLYQSKKDIDKAIFYYEKYLYLGGKKEKKVTELLRSLKKKKS